MPSNRRFKATILLVALIVIITIYITSAGHQTRSSPFYTRTSDALALREAEEQGGRAIESDDLEVQKRLREAEEKAKAAADKKGAEFHGEDVKKKAEKVKEENEAMGGGAGADGQKAVKVENKVESEEEHKAEAELNFILKRSPSKRHVRC
jgi:hypothetical protein